MHIPRHSSRSTQPTINRSFSHRFKKGQAFGPVLFLYRNPAGLKLIRQNAPASARGRAAQEISAEVAAALQIRLSDAHCPQKSSRSAGPQDDAEIREVRRAAACAVRGVCLLRAWLPTCVLRKKLAGRAKGDTGMQNQERKSVHRLRRPVCSLLQVCLPACVLRKKLAGEPGGDAKIQKSGAEVCPSPALSRVFAFTSVPAACGFPHKKIPRRESRGIFIRHLR